MIHTIAELFIIAAITMFLLTVHDATHSGSGVTFAWTIDGAHHEIILGR